MFYTPNMAAHSRKLYDECMKAIIFSLLLCFAAGPAVAGGSRSSSPLQKTAGFLTSLQRKTAQLIFGRCKACENQGIENAVHRIKTLHSSRVYGMEEKNNLHNHGWIARVTIYHCKAGHVWAKRDKFKNCWCGWEAEKKLAKVYPIDFQKPFDKSPDQQDPDPQQEPAVSQNQASPPAMLLTR